MRLFVSALEYSANIHLKYLLRELIKNENVELCGIFDEKILSDLSGESNESSGKSHKISGESICKISEVAVMGFIDVLKRARFFLTLRAKCLNVALKADKVLLMDSSSFNIPLAKKIKARDCQKEIMYYILPQVWAWKPWRARVIEANCDKLCAILPFEVSCYATKARFVGHPLLDEIKEFKNGDSLCGNSSLDKHSADLLNFGRSQTPSLVSRPKFSKSNESHTENPSVVLNAPDSSLRGSGEATTKQSKSRKSNIQSESMIDKRIDKSNSTLQHCDSNNLTPCGLDSSLVSLAQNDKSSVDCFDLHSESRNDENIAVSKATSDSCGSILDEKSGLRSHEQGNRTNGSLTKRVASLPDLSLKDNAHQNTITFMPGSRIAEISRIFPIFLQVKDALKAQDSATKFILVIPRKFSGKNLVKIYGDLSDFEISFDSHSSLLKSKFAFICSGTATLECALIGTPFVLGYLGRWIEAFVVERFLHIRFVGLANILYNHIKNDETFHDECLQENLTAKNLLDSYHHANPSEFLTKSKILRKYLKSGSAKAVAKWLLQG